MAFRVLTAPVTAASTDPEGSFLKFYTLNGSGGRDFVRFPRWAIIERITITDPDGTDQDVIIENAHRTGGPMFTTVYTEISRLNPAAEKYAIDQLDFLCGSLPLYIDPFNGDIYTRLRIRNLPVNAFITFRYYRHPHPEV